MKLAKTMVIAIASTLCATSFAETFTNVTQALEVFQQRGADFRASLQASKYLKEHPEESIAPLLEIVKSKGYRWQTAGSILAKTKNEEVLHIYMELLADNLFEKEADGSRKLSPPTGANYGAQIAEYLGKMGDKRAIPVLKKAVEQGDFQVSRSALEALFYLNDISMAELFEMASKEKYPSTTCVILSIAHDAMRSDPTNTLPVLDRIIDSFPEQKQNVGLSHMYKMECYEKIGRYEQAIQEAEQALKYSEIDYLFEHISERKQEISDEMKN